MDETVMVANPREPVGPPSPPAFRVIAVTSGKGGVGKTNVVLNLGIALAQAGQRVLVLDADIGLGNVDVLLGIVPRYTLSHVLAGERRLSEIMVRGPEGIMILPAGSAEWDLTALSSEQQVVIQEELEELSPSIDVLLLDTGAGISSNVLFFAAASQEILVVASPEPTSMADAYAVMKVLAQRYRETRFRLLVNMAKNRREALEVYRRLLLVSGRFLNISIDYAGMIPADDYLPMAVQRQQAVLAAFPHAPSSAAFRRLAEVVLEWEPARHLKGGVQFFWHRLLLQA
ncbi:MAG: MinD/ParA family protein [Nitrospiraceae bacterium]